MFYIEFAISEIYRVLKPNGIAYLRFPSYEIIIYQTVYFAHRIKNKKILKMYMSLAFT